MTVSQTLGKIAQEKGAANEQKVHYGVSCVKNLPEWFQGIRNATREEDHKGIDIVIKTDVGDIYLQVKSSKKQAALYKRKARKQMVGMVVVKVDESPERLGARAMAEVSRLRCQILADRT